MKYEKSPSDGDVLLWTALSLSVERIKPEDYIEISKCYDPITEQFYRRPDRINLQTKDILSRDMLLGLILLGQIGNYCKPIYSFVDKCIRTGIIFPSSMSSDSRHKMTPNMYWLLSTLGYSVPWYYKLTNRLLKPSLKLSVYFTEPGYQLHLIAVQAYILHCDGHNVRDIGKALTERQPDNPFFRYLAQDYTMAKILVACYYSNIQGCGDKSQWALERADSEHAWKDSMGWDCVFINKLLENV